ncbi:MAG TPA: ComEA family DNA-binding protein [Mycobacteriales bacterium]|nr:ComEA family DNA-binding protein [Mycobacteriales bacterium]
MPLPWSRPGEEDDGALRLRVLRALGHRPDDAVAPAASGVEPIPDAPAPAPPARSLVVDPTRRGATALVALAVAAAGLTVAVVWRGRAQPMTVAVPTVVSSAVAEPPEDVVVDVQGGVRRPGLVRLAAGSRVADAIAAAGGLKPGATTIGLNLARRLADGEQVLVLPPGTTPPAVADAGTSAPGSTPGGKLDLNLATLEQLDALPGVGPVTAQRIIAWRTEHGRFATVDQLREIDGIGDKRFDTLRDLVVV